MQTGNFSFDERKIEKNVFLICLAAWEIATDDDYVICSYACDKKNVFNDAEKLRANVL